MSALNTVIAPIHRAGWPFIGIALFISLIFFQFSVSLGWIGLVVAAWCTYFFRNPDRTVPTREGLVVSPADGRVAMITEAVPPAELGMGSEPMMRISIFLNIFNVHINRVPVGGEIEAVVYQPGKFLNADLDKASEDNERNSLRIRLADGRQVGVVQIAGLVARRILCFVNAGTSIKTGERFGLIRFGSRNDVYLPIDVKPLVAVGQTAIAGETVLADLTSTEPARAGEVR